jgi:hypothetical protein
MLDKKLRAGGGGAVAGGHERIPGVQLKVGTALHDPKASGELRHLLVSLTGSRGRRDAGAPAWHRSKWARSGLAESNRA